jgi:hypothetical protein
MQQHNNESNITKPLTINFVNTAVYTDFSLRERTAFFSPYQLTKRLIDSVYEGLTDSLADVKDKPSVALPQNQATHSFALQSLAREYQQNHDANQEDLELLMGMHLRKQDQFAKKAVDEFHADLVRVSSSIES